jgi:5-formyltetrahydrofolate cyclo-ligase
LTREPGLAERKATMRRRMLRVRAQIPQGDRARLSALIEEALFALPEVASARTLLLFYSFGSEVATRDMIRRALGAGARVLLPYLEDGRMEAAEVRPGDELSPTEYGAREPARTVPVDPGEVDVVVTPGLAFDRAGRRLGYGGAHYDRFLDRLSPEALRVGIAFSAQLVDEVPAGPRDRRVQVVVNEAGAIDCRPVQ